MSGHFLGVLLKKPGETAATHHLCKTAEGTSLKFSSVGQEVGGLMGIKGVGGGVGESV